MSRYISQRYTDAIKQAAPIVLILSLASAIIVYGVAKKWGPEYEVHFSYLVSLSQRETGAEYKFDGFYALQSTESFTATIAKWVSAPEVVVGAYKGANMSVPQGGSRAISQSVRAEKTAPQLVQVTIKDKDEEKARRLAEGVQAVMTKNIETYHQQGTPALTFRVVPTSMWTGKTKLDEKAIAIMTFVAVLVVGLNAVLLTESLKEFREESDNQ